MTLAASTNSAAVVRPLQVLVMIVAVGIFVWLGIGTVSQHLTLNTPWMIVLVVGTILPLGLCGTLLWRRTRFS